MNWTAILGPKAVLEAENERLRRTLAERDAKLAQLSSALDDALDREQLHSLTAPHERLTPAAVLDRFDHPRAQHPAPESIARGSASLPASRVWSVPLESTAAGVPVAADRRRSR
ncbi:hypothetical protein ACWIGI_05660 [Nocardia sp. NPDC055321]